jgi:cytoskeletal protein CcmA (bactofilin family)
MIWRRDEGRDDPQPEEHPYVTSEGRKGRQMADQGTEVTVIGHGARLEGTVVSAGSLRVDGQIRGKIQADGDVMLSAQSQVEADIQAENVSVAGRFKGNIVVKHGAELARGGRVDGNITSKTLVVQEGGVFCGQSIMDQQAQRAQQGESGKDAEQVKQVKQPSPATTAGDGSPAPTSADRAIAP